MPTIINIQTINKKIQTSIYKQAYFTRIIAEKFTNLKAWRNL